jgi:hypothetical protein
LIGQAIAPHQESGDHRKDDDERKQHAFTKTPCRRIGRDHHCEHDPAQHEKLDRSAPWRKPGPTARRLMTDLVAHPTCPRNATGARNGTQTANHAPRGIVAQE